MKQQVYNELDKMGIKYEVINHPPAETTKQADDFIEGKEGVRSKTMFMSDKKKRNFYLLILDDSKRLDIKRIGELIGEKSLKLGNEENLKEKMNLQFGVVSPLGLINNRDKDIKVYVDKELLGENIITFHPNENDATIFIKMEDMFRFLDNLGYEYKLIEM